MKVMCHECSRENTAPDLSAAIHSRGYWWCRKHARVIVVAGFEVVDFPSEGKLIPETIMEQESE
jgi:hypothetical protein